MILFRDDSRTVAKFTGTALPVCLVMLALLTACNPTVKVEAPDKPIEINMNIKIEHKVKVEIEKDVKQSITKNKDIF